MSRLEEQMALQIRAAGLPAPQREYRAIRDRRFRVDFAWPEAQPPLALEVDGGVLQPKRGDTRRGVGHTSISGMLADKEKQAELVCAGWRVMSVAANHVRDGRALRWVERALAFKRRA